MKSHILFFCLFAEFQLIYVFPGHFLSYVYAKGDFPTMHYVYMRVGMTLSPWFHNNFIEISLNPYMGNIFMENVYIIGMYVRRHTLFRRVVL